MTDSEFSTFAKRLFSSFPELWEWLNNKDKCPDPTGMQEAWRDTLRTCRLDECLFVLDGWISETREPFSPFERGRVALVMRQSVYFDRDIEAKKNKRFNHTDEYRKAKRGEYKPLASSVKELAPLFKKVLPINADERAGLIDQNERRRRIMDLLANEA